MAGFLSQIRSGVLARGWFLKLEYCFKHIHLSVFGLLIILAFR